VVAEDLEGGVSAWGAGDDAAGMRACSAQIQTANRHAILRPAGDRAHEEKLNEVRVAVKNVASGEAIGAFEVERGENLARENSVWSIGGAYTAFFFATRSPSRLRYRSRSSTRKGREYRRASRHNFRPARWLRLGNW
jgi:hypothetical protein